MVLGIGPLCYWELSLVVIGIGPCCNGNWALCMLGKHQPLSYSPSPVAKEMKISKENGKGGYNKKFRVGNKIHNLWSNP